MEILWGNSGYIITAGSFVFLFLLLLTTKNHSLQRNILICSAVIGFIWALTISLQATYSYSKVQILGTETLRNLSWFLLFISALTREKSIWKIFVSNVRVTSLVSILVFISVLEISSPYLTWFNLSHAIVIHLGQSAIGMWLLEQLFRRADTESRWALKPLCLGFGLAYAYDFALYADASLVDHIDLGFWYARGWVMLLTFPLILLTTRRAKQWSTRIYISREVVYHSTLLAAAGAYLIAMALAGYYIKYANGNWGSMMQNVFFALSGLILASLFLSDILRRHLRVLISKHFFANKYEYREEWMKFAAIMEEDDVSPYQVALNAIIRPFACEHGMLASLEGNRLQHLAYHNMSNNYPDSEKALIELISQSIEQQWIVDIESMKAGKGSSPIQYDSQFLSSISSFSYIIPIIGSNGLRCACLISTPKSTHSLNWEDRDLMWAISKQLSVFLNLYHTNQTLAENQQFDTFNRMSAFLAHDLKNVLAQLQLLAKNGQRHKHNPEFIDDAFETIDSAVSRLQKVVSHLKKKDITEVKDQTFSIDQAINKVCTSLSNFSPTPSFDAYGKDELLLTTDKERFISVISHLIQNAQEATPTDGYVRISTAKGTDHITICIEDNGMGMTDEFIESRLFKPFDTTKGNSGMGIGAYDAKKMVENLNGYIDVQSSSGKGSKFILYIPLQSQI
ncbi:XrtA/PEP-CTERM system histidine kinase PrsK [Vibrio algarum]|uniref:histidine kinase n=1 Tax=Vibrio algarum TaxID=3020714 RepID=A0ABT4YQ69_9VIBR|nr:XrtA/PEP-CTERM system histidine kinase PrsK [Vibrio sp. KJ40-1]MDB1123697.1 PEP-CTERM system histidine kinase PrsK [Vibrio sp. KJ40-1]